MAASAFSPPMPSVAHAVLRHAASSGSSLALLDATGAWTYAALGNDVLAVASALEDMRPASRPLALLLGMDLRSVSLLLAADLMGIPAVLLPASLPRGEVRNLQRSTGAALVLRGETTAGSRVGLRLREPPAGTRDVPTLSLPGHDGPKADVRPWWQRGDILLCQQTSGSAGGVKLAVRTRLAVDAEISSVSRATALMARDVVLCASSIAHSYGCVGGLLTPLSVGATTILASGADDMRRALSRYRPTVVFGLGPMYDALLRSDSAPAARALSVRLAFSAGAPLRAGLFEAFGRRFGLPIRQDYGTTEAGTISLDLAAAPDPDSVGTPLDHMHLQLHTPARARLQAGEQGEIAVRSPALAAGYVYGQTLVPCTDDGGWYHTRDAGAWKDGALTLGHRLREPVVIDGTPVDLDIVEEVMASCEGVREVVVTSTVTAGRPVLVATVVAPGLDRRVIARCTAQHLPPESVPSRIVLRPELPRSPAGKLLGKYLP